MPSPGPDDSDNELHSFEPMRVIFAVASLLLGFVVALHG